MLLTIEEYYWFGVCVFFVLLCDISLVIIRILLSIWEYMREQTKTADAWTCHYKGWTRKKNVGEANRKRRIVDMSVCVYAALSSASTLLSEKVNEWVCETIQFSIHFKILHRKKAYACVMLSVDHRVVVDGDGTSSLFHSSSGISSLHS
jgi:hypothetical protein